MSSAAESELGDLYIVAREAACIIIVLQKLVHKQPRTPMQNDNSTVEGVINNKTQLKRTKSMGMQFYWLRDRECQKRSLYIGKQARLTTPTNGQNTAPPHIIKTSCGNF